MHKADCKMSVRSKMCARFLLKIMHAIQRLPFVERPGESCKTEAANAFKSSSPRREKIMKLFLNDSDTERTDSVEIFSRTKALHRYVQNENAHWNRCENNQYDDEVFG